MSTKQHNTYIVNIPKKDLEDSLDTLFLSDYSFEFLGIDEVEGQWKVQEYKQEGDYSNELNVVSSLLERWKKTGFIASLLDQRYTINRVDIERAQRDQKVLWHVSEVLAEYYDTEDKLNELSGFKTNKKFGYLVGHQLEAFQKEVREESVRIMEEFNAQNPDQAVEIPKTIFPSKISTLGDLEVLEFEFRDLDIVETFLKDHLHVKLFRDFYDHTLEKKAILKEKCLQLDINPDNPKIEDKKQIAAFSVLITLHEKKQRYYSYISSLEESSEDVFFFVYSDASESEIVDILPAMGAIETVDWDESIIDWKAKGSMKSFKGIVSSLGTIEKGEVDPTGVLAVFFMIFFAFCLGDALYGLFISLVTGYFLFFTKLKEELKGMFSLFFYSGLAAVVFGALTNSWGGDLLTRTPLAKFTEYFQVIDLLESSSYTPPVNQFLNNNLDVSPIVAMLGFTVLIGIVHITVAYILKILTNLGQGKQMQALQTVVWMLFLFTLVVSIITGVWYLVAGGAALLFFVQDGGIVSKISGLFGQIYGLISLFSDILSYTRLIAVGLTSGIIAQVVNLLAELAYDSSPAVLNILLLVSVLLIGHSFNLLVALFGAYINPLRLHYVEFMPKFFQGTARPFKPVDNTYAYANIAPLDKNDTQEAKRTIKVEPKTV